MSWRNIPGSSPWRDDEKRRRTIRNPDAHAAVAAALSESFPPASLPDELRRLLAKLR